MQMFLLINANHIYTKSSARQNLAGILIYKSTTHCNDTKNISDRQIQDPRSGRRQYLIIYSQADMQKFSTKESFGSIPENDVGVGIE